MILAEGLLLATDGSKSLYLIEPDTTAFKPLAKAELLGIKSGEDNSMAGRIGGSSQNWAPIALADGKLLIRDQSKLLCVKVVGLGVQKNKVAIIKLLLKPVSVRST